MVKENEEAEGSVKFLMNSRNDMVELVHVMVDGINVKSCVKQFFRVEGDIKDFKLHPSNEYVVILTDTG